MRREEEGLHVCIYEDWIGVSKLKDSIKPSNWPMKCEKLREHEELGNPISKEGEEVSQRETSSNVLTKSTLWDSSERTSRNSSHTTRFEA